MCVCDYYFQASLSNVDQVVGRQKPRVKVKRLAPCRCRVPVLGHRGAILVGHRAKGLAVDAGHHLRGREVGDLGVWGFGGLGIWGFGGLGVWGFGGLGFGGLGFGGLGVWGFGGLGVWGFGGLGVWGFGGLGVWGFGGLAGGRGGMLDTCILFCNLLLWGIGCLFRVPDCKIDSQCPWHGKGGEVGCGGVMWMRRVNGKENKRWRRTEFLVLGLGVGWLWVGLAWGGDLPNELFTDAS